MNASITNRPLRQWATTLGLTLAMMMLTACDGGDFADLEKYIQEVKARPKGAIEPLPEPKIVEPFIFKPDGLRDPFQPVQKALAHADDDMATGGGIRPDTERRKEVLEAYSLDSLRMVGTLKDPKGIWGLVKTKDGTVHSVRVGNYIGQNYGKIIRILEDRIELMEIVPDKPGTWREQQAAIAMAE
ncbi:MAG: pilus assembly protein PilP [Methylomonas sp.]|nr:pilus assembly protein PilP [Methylomonas sp.]PPD20710.1 MAG: pilus assembly protein PilP [Methylomonas sp.]PPD25052.1 MAG: pilus assembly protein PilP [Methylomonas sp.]PPD34367.1 MAG: pilus assembly protein PilP [Methylomonas sp.]PPD38960.1 MAG: pilus assembly protein PilP [Methylomonas sp.]